MPNKTSLLIKAIKRGDVIFADDLIRKRIDIDTRDSNGWPPIYHAVVHGQKRIIQLLIDAGVDINRRNNTYALYLAVIGGQLNIIEMLLNLGAIQYPVSGIPLIKCVPRHLKNAEAIRKLLESHAGD